MFRAFWCIRLKFHDFPAKETDATGLETNAQRFGCTHGRRVNVEVENGETFVV